MKMDLPHLAHISFYNSWLKPRNKTFFFFNFSCLYLLSLKRSAFVTKIALQSNNTSSFVKKKPMMHFEGDFSTRKCIENSIESLHTEEIRG